MHIKSILSRLQGVTGQADLWENIVLLPGQNPVFQATQTEDQPMIQFIVGYTGSVNSHNALDLALWIAHQTRLATRKLVAVHAVYVMNDEDQSQHRATVGTASCPLTPQRQTQKSLSDASSTAVMEKLHPLKQVAVILEQAQILAQEWGSPFCAQFHNGAVAASLRQVVQSEGASLLVLGCDSARHWLIQELRADFPCPVLGIPSAVNSAIGSVL